jgi:hypothetical protein
MGCACPGADAPACNLPFPLLVTEGNRSFAAAATAAPQREGLIGLVALIAAGSDHQEPAPTPFLLLDSAHRARGEVAAAASACAIVGAPRLPAGGIR